MDVTEITVMTGSGCNWLRIVSRAMLGRQDVLLGTYEAQKYK
jgi:hypothetical protein